MDILREGGLEIIADPNLRIDENHVIRNVLEGYRRSLLARNTDENAPKDIYDQIARDLFSTVGENEVNHVASTVGKAIIHSVKHEAICHDVEGKEVRNMYAFLVALWEFVST